MTASPAAGPLTWRGHPESEPATNPPTIPVISPAAGGAPEAMAMPMQRGSATRNTTIEARASWRSVWVEKMDRTGVFLNLAGEDRFAAWTLPACDAPLHPVQRLQ